MPESKLFFFFLFSICNTTQVLNLPTASYSFGRDMLATCKSIFLINGNTRDGDPEKVMTPNHAFVSNFHAETYYEVLDDVSFYKLQQKKIKRTVLYINMNSIVCNRSLPNSVTLGLRQCTFVRCQIKRPGPFTVSSKQSCQTYFLCW